MPILHSEAQVLYARYLKSGMTLEDFCRKHQIPYWDFSDWINRWEKRYGGKFVENATKVYYKNVNRLTPGKTSSYQSNAQSLLRGTKRNVNWTKGERGIKQVDV